MALANQIEEVLKLVAETGDRCIVVSEGKEPFVVMDLSQYRTLLKTAAGREKVANLTEAELLEKINQDIAEWRESRAEELTEYEVSQFRVADSAQKSEKPVQEQVSQPAIPPSLHKVFDRPVPNIPFVDDVSVDEFRLEPLG